MQIIVLGMHRSGTSAVAGALHLMGAYVGATDVLMAPQPDNSRGFWERTDVADLNDRVLASTDASWWNIAGFDASRVPEQALEGFEADAAKILTDLESHRPWIAKDPRFCLLLPLWLRLLDRPVCVMVHRDPVEIALSLKQRNGFSLTQGIALWEHYMVSALRSIRHDRLLLVSYQDLIADAEATTLDLLRRLRGLGVDGLAPADDRELAAFVDPDLQHHRGIQFDGVSLLNDAQSRLARSLGDGIVPSASDDFKVSLGAEDAAAELAARESAEHDARDHLADLERRAQESSQSSTLLGEELDRRAAHIRQIEENLDASNQLRAGLERELSRTADHQRKVEAEISTLEEQIAQGATYARHVETELDATRDRADRAEQDAHRTREAMTRLESDIRALESRPLVRLSLWLQKLLGADE
jgi:hypothetical protein